jgi:cytochrome P450
MIFAIVSAVLSVILLAVSRWLYASWTPRCGLPQPRSFGPLGHFPHFLKHYDDYLDWITEVTRELGSTWTFWLPGQPRFVVITEPRDVEYMLKGNFAGFEKGAVFRARFHRLLGDGIFNADGPQWRTQRKTAALMFKVSNFRNHMSRAFLRHGHELVERVAELGSSTRAFDLQDLLFRFTLDSIGEIGFGTNVDSMHKPDLPFPRAFDFCQEAMQARFLTPCWELRQYLHPMEFRFRREARVLDQFADEVIRKSHEDPDLATRDDLLAIFMRSRNEHGEPFSDTYLRDLIMNFAIAGRDTTAQGLSWMFFRLTREPEVLARLVEEIDRVLQGRQPDYNMLKRLPYAHACFSEALRLHPPVPKDAKVALQDCTLPSGHRVPKGAFLTYVPYVMARLESNWEHPERFDPLRFLEEDSDAPAVGPDAATHRPALRLRQMDPFKFVSFQAGPRVCLGKDMAYVEAKLVICLLLQRYRFRLAVDPAEITYAANITLPMKNGLSMFVDKRTDGPPLVD